MMKQIPIVVAVICMMLIAIDSAQAAIPHLISFQGKLNDSDGTPLNGEFEITFRIYNVAEGSTPLWSEMSDVSCEDGMYSVILGLTTRINLDFDGEYWLGVQVTGDEELSPRYRIVSVPVAFWAAVAESAVTAASANQASWNNLTDVPPGFADGTDDVGEGGARMTIGAVRGKGQVRDLNFLPRATVLLLMPTLRTIMPLRQAVAGRRHSMDTQA